jgi:hypothetical protein
MPLVIFLHLLNVFVQLANKRGFTKKIQPYPSSPTLQPKNRSLKLLKPHISLNRQSTALLTVFYCHQISNPTLQCRLLLNYFPSQWKVAQIIILKPGNPHALPSYWPISLLSIVSKVFEMLLLTRLLSLVEHNGLIPSHQFGF